MHPSTRKRLILAILVVCVTATFAQVCWHDFTWWDDGDTVHHNPHFNPPTVAGILHYWHHGQAGLYIPVTYTLWGLLAFIAHVQSPDQLGTTLNPWVYHSANLLAHLLSTITVFAILRRLSRHAWPAMAGALLFALHPVQVEAVSWVSGMKDLLCGFFTLLALWQYIQTTGKDGRARSHYVAAMLCFVLALLSKPTAMVAPVLALIIDFLLLQRPLRQIAKSLAPWLIVLIPFLFITRYVQTGQGVPTSPIYLRPLIALDSIAFYLYKLVFPISLAMDYGRTPHFIASSGPIILGHTLPWIYISWLLPACVAIFIYRVRQSPRWLVASSFLFIAGMLPTIGLVPFLFQYYSTTADHYLYLPMLGPAMALTFLLARYRTTLLRWIGAVILLALSIRSSFQTRYWTDDLSLYTHDLEVNPNSAPANLNLGRVMLERGQTQQALYYMRRAVDSNPDYRPARENLSALTNALEHVPEKTDRP